VLEHEKDFTYHQLPNSCVVLFQTSNHYIEPQNSLVVFHKKEANNIVNWKQNFAPNLLQNKRYKLDQDKTRHY